MHKAQTLKRVSDRKLLRQRLSCIFGVQLVKSTPGRTHLRAAAASAAVGHEQGQAQHSFGGAQLFLEQYYNWGSKVAVSKIVSPILEWDTLAFSWLKITQLPHLFIPAVHYISILCFPPDNVMESLKRTNINKFYPVIGIPPLVCKVQEQMEHASLFIRFLFHLFSLLSFSVNFYQEWTLLNKPLFIHFSNFIYLLVLTVDRKPKEISLMKHVKMNQMNRESY